jgi:hypothetical protein
MSDRGTRRFRGRQPRPSKISMLECVDGSSGAAEPAITSRVLQDASDDSPATKGSCPSVQSALDYGVESGDRRRSEDA